MEIVPVPPEVAEQARAALAERAKNEGIVGNSKTAVVCALELAQSPFVAESTLALVGAWHSANPNATTTDGRCTRLAGLYGGAAGRRWALEQSALPTTSWLTEESATLDALIPKTAAPETGEGDEGLPPGKHENTVAAGIAVVALDTGRVLMLQRCMDPEDPAAGMWEVPGGKIDPGESPLDAAEREFAEETGHPAPGIRVGDEWLSPNGVYALFCHVVAAERDVRLNLDADDRMVGNPDDPDGAEIEVVAWWLPEHMKDNPALREEARGWFPWDELAQMPEKVKIPTAQTAAYVTEDEARSAAYRDMTVRAQRARDRLEERLSAAAQVAMRDALRRAGAKVVQRASRRSNAAKAAVAAANGRWTPAVLAAVGITEADLIRQAFDSLGERYETWVLQAAAEQLRAVANILGLPSETVIARMQTRMDAVAAASRARLNEDLTKWAYRLLAEPSPSFGDVGEVPVDPTLPKSILRPALSLADGRRVAADGDPTGEGLLLEAWLTFDADAPVEMVVWRCGDPARPFPPHHELCDTTVAWADYASVFASDAGSFPRGETYWFPGDHAGCECSEEYTYVSAREAGLI